MGNEILTALGLCARARKCVFGTDAVCLSLRGKERALLVLTCNDNSENTVKKINDKCAFRKTRVVELDCDGGTLAHAVGKTGKLSAVGITDENFVRLILSKL